MEVTRHALFLCMTLALLAQCTLTSPVVARQQLERLEVQNGENLLRARRSSMAERTAGAEVVEPALLTSSDSDLDLLLHRLRRSMAHLHQGSFHFNPRRHQSRESYRHRRHRRRHHHRHGRVHDA